jgi:hypothetical protein
MRGVDHLALELNRAGVGIFLKGADDGAGMVEGVLGWCEGSDNDSDLSWVNGHHADKAIPHASPGIVCQSVQVSECRKDRFYGGVPAAAAAKRVSERTTS